MIARYTRPEMAELWSEESKFRGWTDSELAILMANVNLGRIPQSSYDAICDNASFTVDRINELDEGLNGFRHDMNAFVECIKEGLRSKDVIEEVVGLFHKDPTSYDIEDPAFCMKLTRSADYIAKAIESLRRCLWERAKEYKETIMIGITHGQPAEPITLAVKLLNWVDILQRDYARVLLAQKSLRVAKFSGAVGVYGDLTPETEESACNALGYGFEPARIATQILHRDRHAAYAMSLALLACNIGHIAHNLWLMSAFPRWEAREPFREGQRGSSRMPHKKNPITLERLRGMATIVRGYLGIILENVMTYDERAIDQSCVERIIWPDLTTLVHYMLIQMKRTVEGMVFFPERMKQNLDSILGQTGSGFVKSLLADSNVKKLNFEGRRMRIYEWIQACAFKAWEQQRHLKDVMVEEGILKRISAENLDLCFDYNRQIKYVSVIYDRFGI